MSLNCQQNVTVFYERVTIGASGAVAGQHSSPLSISRSATGTYVVTLPRVYSVLFKAECVLKPAGGAATAQRLDLLAETVATSKTITFKNTVETVPGTANVDGNAQASAPVTNTITYTVTDPASGDHLYFEIVVGD